jgi:acetyl esterase
MGTHPDPEVARWMARVRELAATMPDLGSADIAAWRRAERELSDAVAIEFVAEPTAGCRVDDVVAGSVRMRRYRPSAVDELHPTQLFLHGGGFAFGSADEVVNDRIIRQRAIDTGVQFFSLDYRLAPEHRFPAALDDAVFAFGWLLDHADELGIDTDRLGVGGVSAGGGIAAGLTLRLRDLSLPGPRHQLLEVPAVTMTPSGSSLELYARGFGLEDLDQLRELYLGDSTSDELYASPLEHPDLAGLPRTLVMTAQFDPLRDAGELFAARLGAAGTDAAAVRGIGQVHGSSTLTARVSGARRWQVVAANELRSRLAAVPSSQVPLGTVPLSARVVS